MNDIESALTVEALDRLLAALDTDRERAAHACVRLREKLTSFFQWRGAASPEECTDRVLTVVAQRLAGGERIGDLPRYSLGVARLVLLEQRRERRRFSSLEADVPAHSEAGERTEARLQALEHCLAELPPENRDLILAYYTDDGRTHIESRKALARRMGIPSNALRIRAHRIRLKLEASVRQFVDRVSEDEK